MHARVHPQAPNSLRQISRRSFVAGAAAAGASALVCRAPRLARAETPASEPLAFYVIGDTHFLANKEEPAKIDTRSATVTAALVDQLNRLPGTSIPNAAGGGTVAPPRGVIHAGDCIDSGDKGGGPHGEMQRTEWARFQEEYGLTGREGRLKFPVYEVHGNHDGPSAQGVVPSGIKERNRGRTGVKNISANGLHYSWDWAGVHFMNLGIVVGGAKEVTRKRRYEPAGSLEFLVADLESQVGRSGRPVIITHHVDMARYAVACNATLPPDSKEWDPCDVEAYYNALKDFNIAAIFYGHTHARNIFKWNGAAAPAATGIPVFNVDNSSHFGSETQSFYYAQLADGALTVREFHTENRWAEAAWTPQTWRVSVKMG